MKKEKPFPSPNSIRKPIFANLNDIHGRQFAAKVKTKHEIKISRQDLFLFREHFLIFLKKALFSFYSLVFCCYCGGLSFSIAIFRFFRLVFLRENIMWGFSHYFPQFLSSSSPTNCFYEDFLSPHLFFPHFFLLLLLSLLFKALA